MTSKNVQIRLPQGASDALDHLTERLGATAKSETIRHLLWATLTTRPELIDWWRSAVAAQTAVEAAAAAQPADGYVRVEIPPRLMEALEAVALPGEPASATIRRLLGGTAALRPNGQGVGSGK